MLCPVVLSPAHTELVTQRLSPARRSVARVKRTVRRDVLEREPLWLRQAVAMMSVDRGGWQWPQARE
ncbi:hypothetical protein [Mumia zhuanghuii]|nr:hypothetical protein [Mumia zhuanghuii]